MVIHDHVPTDDGFTAVSSQTVRQVGKTEGVMCNHHALIFTFK